MLTIKELTQIKKNTTVAQKFTYGYTKDEERSILMYDFTLGISYSTHLEKKMLEGKHFALQANDEICDDEFSKMLSFVSPQLAKLDIKFDFVTLIENLRLIVRFFQLCQTQTDYIDCASLAYKLFTGKSSTRFVIARVKAIFGQVQTDKTGELLQQLRKAMNFAEEVKENPLIKKMTTLYSYLLVQGVLSRLGLSLTEEEYSRIEIRAMNLQYSSRKQMWMSVLDTTLFICERIHEYRLTGDLSAFTHGESEYVKWLEEADELLALAPFTGNLAAHNTTYFSFIANLNSTIEKGEAYSKFTKKTSGSDILVLRRKLQSLLLLKNTEITKKAAAKERRAPFGVLVHGDSSVGKSTFTKMLYYYYGSVFGLEKDDHFMYVRNPSDEYWSNFDTSKWCIRLDDIGFLLPSKTTQADPTLLELLNVVNNVPYVPAQADLADKGKTPVMARLVIASSNAKDLNAQEYFWCPLAIQRRLPYVVHITPKDEYKHANRKFIDPSKLPPIEDCYPDYWTITVQRVKPYSDGQRDLGVLEDVAKYEDVREFLRDFGHNAKMHECIQDKALVCDVGMKSIEVCSMCLNTKDRCDCTIQFGEEMEEVQPWRFAQRTTSSWRNWPADLCWKLFRMFVEFSWFLTALRWLATYGMFRRIVFSQVVPRMSDAIQMSFVGRVNGILTTPRHWKLALAALSACVAAATLYMSLRPRKEKMEKQGNVHETTELDLPVESTKNVWYNPTLELTKFDLPVASQSSANITPHEVRDMFSANCVRLMVETIIDGVSTTRSNAAVFIKGHLCVTNNHAFRDDADIYRVTIIRMTVSQGVTSNLTLTIFKNDLVRMVENDALVFEVRALPPFKDITKYWDISNGDLFTRGVILRRQESGELEMQELFNMKFNKDMQIEALGISVDMITAMAPRETRKGDCGALAIALTPRGPVAFGFHTVGAGRTCGNMHISIDLIQKLISEHIARFGVSSEVQGGGMPQLDLINQMNPLTVPHHKSIIRYMDSGCANVYGSFTGFRPKPKSSVSATPLQAEMLDHFNVEVNHGKPCMEGWEPWRKNVIEMVRPQVNYRKDILTACVDSYTKDILSTLPEGWQKELVFLSPRAAVNGLPGVKFIDKLNTNTSMGFPWNCTKKQYLHAAVDEIYPEGVDFTPEVWARVAEIEARYKRGERAFPVFTGHLKDEPVTFAKVAAKKTRVFTGAPVDWSLVVRSKLLSYVRLLQKNKFIFEAGPGTVCQSGEWGKIHSYLTTFGKDRIIAGDYGKFDKRMIADFILAAYNIIAQIHVEAGFSREEVQQILCIGEDTAFPLVNMNGDLIEFFGTNPSGHPLTVVINSMVNSLYMRYCYVILNPEHECDSFKKNVHLFTYGDDNIMGVKKDCDWFNHTGIQAELAAIGVEYTMADKESESVPFISIDDCQFLKRMWRFDENVGAWMCPLEEASIHKSLTVWVPSKTIDPYNQMVAVISSANSEYFFYGREVFEHHHAYFAEILQREPYSHYVTEGTLPNWEQLVDRFHRSG